MNTFTLVKCTNYLVCEKKCPQIVLNYHSGVCSECNYLFGVWKGGKGVLSYLEDLECCICFETKICVSQPNCNHFICIDCFKMCYFNKNNSNSNNNEPIFPYPEEIKNEYFEDLTNPKWENDEKINTYLNELEEWYKEKLVQNLSNHYLKYCALCRK
jgi:hypothetical protein